MRARRDICVTHVVLTFAEQSIEHPHGLNASLTHIPGWEPETNILDKNLIREFLQRRKRKQLDEMHGTEMRQKSKRTCVPIAAQRARLMSNADHDTFADEDSSTDSESDT